jgi:hypothetical protein
VICKHCKLVPACDPDGSLNGTFEYELCNEHQAQHDTDEALVREQMDYALTVEGYVI